MFDFFDEISEKLEHIGNLSSDMQDKDNLREFAESTGAMGTWANQVISEEEYMFMLERTLSGELPREITPEMDIDQKKQVEDFAKFTAYLDFLLEDI